MSDEPKKYTTSNFKLLDKHLDLAVSREKEITRDRQSKTFWRNAKSISLVLLAFGIFLIMLGYAYYLSKDDKVIEKVVTVPEKIIERQVPINNSSSSDKNSTNSKSANNQNKNNNVNTENNTDNNKSFLQDNIITNSISKLLPSSETSNNVIEGNRIKNVVKFSYKELTINNKSLSVVTRYNYFDTNDEEPYAQSCYLQFNPYKYELSTYLKGVKKNVDSDDAIAKLGFNNVNQLRSYCSYMN